MGFKKCLLTEEWECLAEVWKGMKLNIQSGLDQHALFSTALMDKLMFRTFWPWSRDRDSIETQAEAPAAPMILFLPVANQRSNEETKHQQ